MAPEDVRREEEADALLDRAEPADVPWIVRHANTCCPELAPRLYPVVAVQDLAGLSGYDGCHEDPVLSDVGLQGRGGF